MDEQEKDILDPTAHEAEPRAAATASEGTGDPSADRDAEAEAAERDRLDVDAAGDEVAAEEEPTVHESTAEDELSAADDLDELLDEDDAAGEGSGQPLELADEADLQEQVADPAKRDWYILKVQSNREDSIRDALIRRLKVAGLEDYFGDIIVPAEMVTEFKNGKKRVVRRKLYPGYIVAHMELTDDTWFLVRETHGIGDFTGSGGKPTPMAASDVARIVIKQEEKTEEQPKLKISFNSGDRVKITEGTFENFEGDVDSIDQANGRVTVMINIFGRSTPVELEYWQLESL